MDRSQPPVDPPSRPGATVTGGSVARPWRSGVTAFGVVLLLSATINANFPGTRASWVWLLPPAEVSLLWLSYAVWIGCGKRVRATVHISVALSLLGWAMFHCIDGAYRRFLNREFRAALDVRLLPDSVRLMFTSEGVFSGVWYLVLGFAGCAVLAVVLTIALKALADAQRSLLFGGRGACEVKFTSKVNYATGALLVGLGLLPLALPFQSDGPVRRVASEAQFFLDLPQARAQAQLRFEAVRERLSDVPSDLRLLRGRDVTVIVIESYGRGALDSQTGTVPMADALEQLQARLTERGAATASAWLLPPTYGGGSWYAHATLTTGVKVWSPLDYSLLLDSNVVSLSRYMTRAGYHTINVMPGTTRVWPEGRFFGFDEELYAWRFDYAGPAMGWGRLPDQFVLDQVRRHVSEPGPIYKEIKLVTSHVPWRSVPTVVQDWDSIGDGAVYDTLPVHSFDVEWSALKDAHAPYMASIIYDLDVVGEYVRKFEAEDSLVLILGDHQPVQEAAQSSNWDVPLHLCGPEALIARFVDHGFVPGLRPAARRAALPMEDFLPLFLSVLSKSKTASNRY